MSPSIYLTLFFTPIQLGLHFENPSTDAISDTQCSGWFPMQIWRKSDGVDDPGKIRTPAYELQSSGSFRQPLAANSTSVTFVVLRLHSLHYLNELFLEIFH